MAKYIITDEAKYAYNKGEKVRITKDGKEISIIDRAGIEKFFGGVSVPASLLRQGYPGCTIDVIK